MSDPFSPPRFHLAFPVHDLAAARHFYGGVLGCREGRSSESWVDFDLYGHQIVAHLDPNARAPGEGQALDGATNTVDTKEVPLRHFGLIVGWERWERLAQHLKDQAADFLIDPYIRFEGKAGEQGTFFVRDPSGNALEFKSFRDPDMVFSTADPGA